MEYLLFTYPNCSNCEKLKEYLSTSSLNWREYSLARRESKLMIRDYLSNIKRNEKGAIIIPALIAREDGAVSAVLNNHEELDDWLKSKG